MKVTVEQGFYSVDSARKNQEGGTQPTEFEIEYGNQEKTKAVRDNVFGKRVENEE